MARVIKASGVAASGARTAAGGGGAGGLGPAQLGCWPSRARDFFKTKFRRKVKILKKSNIYIYMPKTIFTV